MRVTLLSFLLVAAISPLFVVAQTAEDTGAVIDFPYYKKEERFIYTCAKDNPACANEQSKHFVMQEGESTRTRTLRDLTVGNIPILGGFVGAKAELTHKKSKKEEELYKKFYTDRYGIEKCVKESKYKVFLFRSEGTYESFCTGPKGTNDGIKPLDFLAIEVRPYKSKGKVVSKDQQTNMTVEHSVIEDSRAILYLTAPEARTILPMTFKEIARGLPKDLVKGAIEEGIDTGVALLPGGFIISGSGVLSPVTGKVKDAIFRDNPVWNVPLSVQVTELVSNGTEITERPVPCAAVKVAKKTLDANCRVTVSISKKQQMRDVTPQASIPYYRYDISLAGPATKRAEASRQSFFASVAAFFGIAQANIASVDDEEEEIIPLDENGFLIVEGANQEELPLVPEEATNVAVPQPSPLPSSDFLANESIFDTISLDLKVNGKDGPVRIAPGSRIVVSWISEGATRCRAVWSRHDIKLSGTVAGRLSRSVTIRAACINAEGERADDTVQVIMDTTSS